MPLRKKSRGRGGAKGLSDRATKIRTFFAASLIGHCQSLGVPLCPSPPVNVLYLYLFVLERKKNCLLKLCERCERARASSFEIFEG